MNIADLVGVVLAPILPVLKTNLTLLIGGGLVIFAIGGNLVGVARFLALVIGVCLTMAAAVPHLPLSGG